VHVPRPLLAALLLASLTPAPARAAGYLFGADTTGQVYRLRDAFGRPVDVRRLTQRVSAYVDEIIPGQHLSFAGSFRASVDFGLGSAAVTTWSGAGSSREHLAETDLFDALDARRFDLLYAVLRWRDRAGRVDVRLGRHLQVDALDLTSFDGLSATTYLPWHIGLEAAFGLLVRESSPLGYDGFEPDGVAEQDRAGTLLGASAFVHGLGQADGRFSYRRVFDGGELAEERIVLSSTVRPWETDRFGVEAQGLFEYDLVHARPTIGQARVEGRVFGPWGVALGFQHHHPRFAADAIWNLFLLSPQQAWRVEAFYDPRGTGPFDAEVAFVVRRLVNRATSAVGLPLRGPGFSEGQQTLGAQLYARYALTEDGRVDFEARVDEGRGGGYVLLAPGASWSFRERTLSLTGRLDVTRARHDLRSGRDAWTFGGWVEGRWVAGELATLGLLVEEHYSDLTRNHLRVFATLELALTP
jgi:hypothetical protein